MNNTFAYLGFGLGLRPQHYTEILAHTPAIDWLEIITENYLVAGGRSLFYLHKIRENYPLAMHGVSLSLASMAALDWDYLKQVKNLAHNIEPCWISDHLCWTGINGLNMHDLLPVPYTIEAINHIVSRIDAIQNYLGQQILIENVSSYLGYKESIMSEWDFICEIVRRSDCYLLLDINNVYVSSINHDFNALDYIKAMPAQRVVQMHLAGYADYGDYIIDTHDAPISEPVWNLYRQALQYLGLTSTLIERDDNIPPLNHLLLELNQAKAIAQDVTVAQKPHCEHSHE